MRLAVADADEKQKLVELRQHPISIKDSTGTSEAHPLNGVLGSILGESPSAQNSRLEEASKTAVDLTNLIKRNKPITNDKDETPNNSNLTNSNGKRRSEFTDEKVDAGIEKKARLSGGAKD